MLRRDFLKTSIISSGISILGLDFWIPTATSSEKATVPDFDLDDVMMKATKFKVNINKLSSINVHPLNNDKHGVIWINLNKQDKQVFIEYARKCNDVGILVPLSNLSRQDINNCIMNVINHKKFEQNNDTAFTYKYKYERNIISIEPESIFFISNEIYGKDKDYQYANVVIFDEGIKIYES